VDQFRVHHRKVAPSDAVHRDDLRVRLQAGQDAPAHQAGGASEEGSAGGHVAIVQGKKEKGAEAPLSMELVCIPCSGGTPAGQLPYLRVVLREP
jgi:hypothetical protein